MNGSITTPIKAVNNRSTATLLSLKKRSTRYLSKWTEIAHSTGPEKAKNSQDMACTESLVSRAQRSTKRSGMMRC